MKISLIVSKGGWHTKELERAAKKNKVELDIVRINYLDDYKNTLKNCGDIIIWFSSTLKTLDRKNTFFQLIRKKNIFNPDCLNFPFLTRKLFQQKYLEQFSCINNIPTFYFLNKKELLSAIPKKINFPIIQKPNYGSQGDGIILLKSPQDIQDDIDFSKYIFQNFINNSGDYRILVIGGKVLGAIKRVAKPGNFLNNVSKGGAATKVNDPDILKNLEKIALNVSSIFDLSICGIDVIFDEKTKKYYLMEINTNPEWKGFQTATNINVAEKIIEHCISINNRKNKTTSRLVKDYFDENYSFLGNQKFHYASRMWLWTKDSSYRKKLDELKKVYLGKSEQEQILSLKQIFAEKINYTDLVASEIRKKYLKKYPQLIPFDKILFKSLFAETIYGKNLGPIVKKVIPDKKLLDLRAKLEKDPVAIATLSTFAVNFFYNTSNYFKNDSLVNPLLFLNIAKKNYTGKLSLNFNLKLYLLTHAIIGESVFYSKKIIKNKEIYLEMLRICEDIILKNYFSISLDNKFEFLVCTKMLEYKTILEKIVFDEAERSLSNNGNFLIGKLNDTQGSLTRNIIDAEHRNVLYIMASFSSKKK